MLPESSKPIEYDPFQKKAIEYINEGNSVLVAAPTGAGKTVIAEHVIETCLQQNQKVIYTAPIKALSNQKFRDFHKNYPDRVGILTGDVTINPDASTLIMTTEIFRNKILEEHSSLKHYSWIIFDELHYMDDFERGSVWEESLMFLPDHMRVLGLSATIPNINELATWLQEIHKRPVRVVVETHRPVPLHFFFQCQNEIYDDLAKLKRFGYAGVDYRKRVARSTVLNANSPVSLIKHLKTNDYLPCIFFTFNRRRTEGLAKEINSFDFVDASEKTKIMSLFNELCKKFDIEHEPSTHDLRGLIERGIAYHHAGMLPTLKEVIEQLFTTRLIKVIFTTETFALGINMPARTVVFDELRKFYGHAFSALKTRDFYQMAGRAGRRSIDKEGYVFLRVNPYDTSFKELSQMIYSEPEKVYSRFNASYATILNLYARHHEKLYDIYPLSFHFFQEKKFIRKKAVESLRAKVNFLKDLGHIRKNQITPKGLFASQVYGYELILSELFDAGLLENLSIPELGILTAAIVYEPRKGIKKPRLTHHAKKLERITNDILFPLLRKEHLFHITPISKACFYHLSNALEAWMRGESFGQIMAQTEVDEGEVIRYLRMCIQLMREMMDTPVSDDLKAKLHQAIVKINRDEVDAEKQLRG